VTVLHTHTYTHTYTHTNLLLLSGSYAAGDTFTHYDEGVSYSLPENFKPFSVPEGSNYVLACDCGTTSAVLKGIKVDLNEHDIEALLDMNTKTPKAKRCYARQGWLHTNTVDFFLEMWIQEARDEEPLGSNSGVYIYPSTVTIKDDDLHPLSTLSRLAGILKGCRDSSIRISSQGGDDAIVSVIFVMVLDGLHYRLLMLFATRDGHLLLGFLDGLGNDVPPWADSIKEKLTRQLASSGFRGSTVCHLDSRKTFKQTNYKDCAVVALDMLNHLLTLTTPDLISESILSSATIMHHVYSCFECALPHRWTAETSALRRQEFARMVFKTAKMAVDVPESFQLEIRKTLSIPRPKIQVKTLFDSLRGRGLHRSYSIVPLKDVFVTRKGSSDRPAVFELDKAKISGFIKAGDEYRLGVWYNDDFGIICPQFMQEDKENNKEYAVTVVKAVSSSVGKKATVLGNDSACMVSKTSGRKRILSHKVLAQQEVAGDAPAAKKAKVLLTESGAEDLEGAKLKVYFKCDEGYKGDSIDHFVLKPQNYGTMVLYCGAHPDAEDVKRFKNSWVLLKKITPACAVVVDPGTEELVLHRAPIYPVAGQCSVVFDTHIGAWRKCMCDAIDTTLVPPMATIRLHDTGIVRKVEVYLIRRLDC
jgi:hypothetical protein